MGLPEPELRRRLHGPRRHHYLRLPALPRHHLFPSRLLRLLSLSSGFLYLCSSKQLHDLRPRHVLIRYILRLLDVSRQHQLCAWLLGMPCQARLLLRVLGSSLPLVRLGCYERDHRGRQFHGDSLLRPCKLRGLANHGRRRHRRRVDNGQCVLRCRRQLYGRLRDHSGRYRLCGGVGAAANEQRALLQLLWRAGAQIGAVAQPAELPSGRLRRWPDVADG